MSTEAQILTILNILVALHLSRALYKSTLFMQNKPNLCVFWAKNSYYEKKQTQTNPIQTQNKAIFCTKNRPQSQNKPNPNPISSGSRHPKFTRHSFSEGGPPAELRNSARQKKRQSKMKTKTMSLNKNTTRERKDTNPILPVVALAKTGQTQISPADALWRANP